MIMGAIGISPDFENQNIVTNQHKTYLNYLLLVVASNPNVTLSADGSRIYVRGDDDYKGTSKRITPSDIN